MGSNPTLSANLGTIWVKLLEILPLDLVCQCSYQRQGRVHFGSVKKAGCSVGTTVNTMPAFRDQPYHSWSLSALPPKVDIRQRIKHVCFVPKADIPCKSLNTHLSADLDHTVSG